MAAKAVSRKLEAFGSQPRLRLNKGTNDPHVTDNGGYILDVSGLVIKDPVALESEINQIIGVITVGLFARRGANVCLLGTGEGVKTLTF
jgi:ribose 5-phosphate isomerase A